MVATKINVKDNVTDGEIDLSMMDLLDVPVKDIAAIKKAHSLDLSNNHLSILPKNFPTLVNLITIDLSRNELKELPEDFGDLIKLKHLDLYKNKLQHLPLSFSKLTALKWLDLKDNPLVPSIAEVAGHCLDAKECQTCAKNIVGMYAKLQVKVDGEIKSREEQRQRSLEENATKIKQEKKKKSKGQKKTSVNIVEESKTPKAELNKVEINNIGGTKPKTNSVPLMFIVFAFKFLSILALFFGISMIVLRISKVKYGSALEDKIRDFAIKLNIPPQLQEILITLYEYGLAVQEMISIKINQLFSTPNMKVVVKSFIEVYQNVSKASTEVYYKIFSK